MSAVSASVGEEPPRKKVRKGTFSCWECKRRKVRCVFRSEGDAACSGCRSRGAECQSQKSVNEDVAASATRSVPDRLGRLESLMETCIRTLTEVRQSTKDSSYDILTPSSSSSTPNVHEIAPVLSLFNDDLLDQKDPSDDLCNGGPGTLSHYGKPKSGNSMSTAEKSRANLLALVPSRLQLESILESTGSWWRAWQYCYPDICTQGESSSLAEFTSRAHSESHLPTLANVLLCIAISIQQLPSTFDFGSIQMCRSAKDLVEEYTSAVTSLVTSDDELITSIEGLECLVLLGKVYLSAGKPRRAWLSFRRAMSVAEIMGLHRSAARSTAGSDGISASRKTSVWWQIYQADRLLSLLFGFSRGLSDEFCDLDACDDKPEIAYVREVAKIAGRVSDRNLRAGGPSYTLTQELEEKLQMLAGNMPRSWWSLPPVSPDSDGAALIQHVMPQFWHYQVELLLHLPFMLRSANEPKYEYNKQMCLRASRDLIDCFTFLRGVACTTFKTCKMVEFQAFTAALVLQLNLHSHVANKYLREDPQQNLDDQEKVDLLVDELARGRGDGTGVAPQAVKVLETLKAAARNGGTFGSRFKLNIPYFGTISIRKRANLLNATSDMPGPPRVARTDMLRGPVISVDQPDVFMAPIPDGTTSPFAPQELPQISFTSSLFANFNDGTTQFLEDDWVISDLDTQAENNRIADLDGTWDWFGEDPF